LHPIVLPGPAAAAPAESALDLDGTLAEVIERAGLAAERRAIAAALAANDNDPRRTADALGVGFRELLGRMRHHGLGQD
jgi:DNA-binding NtrC family response regulator